MNKLGGFGPVYVINLPRRTDRLEHIKKIFKDYDITNYTIIDAFDAKDELDHLIDYKPVIRKSVRKVEVATTMSHIKAIKYWIDNSDTDYAIFCEDDLSFDTVQYWGWNWQEFIDSINIDFDVIQLSITQFSNPKFILHKKRNNEYSANVYILKRNHAIEIIKRMFKENKYYISGDRANSVADHDVIFGYTDKCYSCGLFTYDINLFSDTNPDGKSLRKTSMIKTMEFWKNSNIKLSNFIEKSI